MIHKVVVEENIVYRHEIEFESQKTEEEIDNMLTEVEKVIGHRTDICSELEKKGVKVLTFEEDESGDIGDFEFIDLEEADDAYGDNE